MTVDEHDLNAVAREAADRINVALKHHEAEDHGGERCHDERVNVLAYLLHRMGGPSDEATWRRFLEDFVRRVRDYQATHEEHDHGQHNGHLHG